jgi:6-phosphogluconolactonase
MAYNVTATTQPATPAQFCSVTGGTGASTTANISSIAVSCHVQYVFVANANDNVGGGGTIGVFTIGAGGVLTATDGTPSTPGFIPVSTNRKPHALAVDPSGPYLYVANQGVNTPPVADADVAIYSIDASGTLTAGAPATVAATDQPLSLALDPAGPYLYVGNNDNAGTGGAIAAFAPVGGVLGAQLTGSPYATDSQADGIAVDAADGAVFVANFSSGTLVGYSIGTGGVLTVLANSPFVVGPTPPPIYAPYAVAVYPTGKYVYVTDVIDGIAAGAVDVYIYDPIADTLTQQQTRAVGVQPKSIAIDPTGQFLYVANSADGTVSGFTVDATTGLLTPIGGAAVATGGGVSGQPTALAIDPSGRYLYVANGDASNITTFAITAVTGVLTAVGSPVNAWNATGGTGTIAIAIY